MPDFEIIPLKSYRYDTGLEGPDILVTGGIHGWEPSGPIGIMKVIDMLDRGHIKLKKGSLTLIPECNPPALEKDVEGINRNLNRGFYYREKPALYEDCLSNAIGKFLENCTHYIDIHTYDEDIPYAFIGTLTKETLAFGRMLGGTYSIHGWEDAFASNVDPEEYKEVMTTEEYARNAGAIASTYECGAYKSLKAHEEAFNVIIRLLHGLKVADFHFDYGEDQAGDTTLVKVADVIYKTKEGTLSPALKDFKPIKKGELIGTYDDGEEVKAPYDAYAMFPNPIAEVGGEWMKLLIDTPESEIPA